MISFPALNRIPTKSTILRDFWKTDITVCIPAYQAENFIGRTLHCAQGQTYGRLRILVSIDQSTDDTVSICRQFRNMDPRIEIIEHDQRLGWCGNVNALLEKVDTPFFFIYFHDDLIMPQYCERLRKALMKLPAAASAHCDMRRFGRKQGINRACLYDGSVAKRLMTLLGSKNPGSLLRSMIRLDRVGADYRLPPEEKDSYTPGYTTLKMRLVSAGPAIPVPKPLYHRWIRTGGLVGGWKNLAFEKVLDGWKRELSIAFPIIDEKVADGEDRRLLKFALTLYALRRCVPYCRKEKVPLPRPQDLHPNALELDIPANLERFDAEIADHLRRRYKKIALIYSEQS